MSKDGPFDPDGFPAELTIWATPGVVLDAARSDLGTVAVLTAVPSITAHTSDDHPGAELVNVIAASLLGSGFALVTGGPGGADRAAAAGGLGGGPGPRRAAPAGPGTGRRAV